MNELKKDLLVYGGVDFNEMDSAEGRYVIADRFAVSSFRVPDEWEHVWMIDDEGNGCPGVVRQVRERTVLIEPEWDCWVPVPEIVQTQAPQYTAPVTIRGADNDNVGQLVAG